MSHFASSKGNFFEDFELGQQLKHGVPRTITEGDVALYIALTGSRFGLNCAQTVAERAGFNKIPLDNLLVFHIAFGKTVNDLSLNAVANLGYAELLFCQPCYPGDTLTVSSEIIGLKENSNLTSGVVYVHSKGYNQALDLVLEWKRWVMVNKKTQSACLSNAIVPKLAERVALDKLMVPLELNLETWPNYYSDNQWCFEQFSVGDKLFHEDGMTINSSEHAMATRLYQNNARVHFDRHLMSESPHGHRLVYGGHVISIARSLSYNGLGNALWLAAVNAGSHLNPTYAGDTIYAHSEILEKSTIEQRHDIGVMRVRTTAFKNISMVDVGDFFNLEKNKKIYHPQVVLDLDWTFLARRQT